MRLERETIVSKCNPSNQRTTGVVANHAKPACLTVYRRTLEREPSDGGRTARERAAGAEGANPTN